MRSKNTINEYRKNQFGVFSRFVSNKGVTYKPYIDANLNNSDFFDFDVYLPTYDMNLQRDFVWSLEQKRELIHSFILERTVPNIVVIQHHSDDFKDYVHQIVDGKQRLSTIISFLKNEFSVILDGEELYHDDFLYELDGKVYNLFKSASTIPLNADIYYDYPDERFSDDDKIRLFKLCNFFGTPQDTEHLNKFKQIKL